MILLQRLLEYTPKSHPDRESLERALKMFRDTNRDFDTKISRARNQNKIIRLGKKFTDASSGRQVDFSAPSRLFLREGPIQISDITGFKNRYFVLFNDLLVCGKAVGSWGSENYRYEWDTEVVEASKCSIRTDLRITGTRKSVILRADTEVNRDQWLAVLQDSCKNHVSRQRSRPTLPISPAKIYSSPDLASPTKAPLEVAPLMLPDDAASDCFICSASFGILSRRHHCRKCGHIVCSACSQHKLKLVRIYLLFSSSLLILSNANNKITTGTSTTITNSSS